MVYSRGLFLGGGLLDFGYSHRCQSLIHSGLEEHLLRLRGRLAYVDVLLVVLS